HRPARRQSGRGGQPTCHQRASSGQRDLPRSGIAVLAVNDIHTYYGDSYVLQGVSLQTEAGKVVALLGRNGVGKTTLVRSIVGLTPPRRGSIVMEDKDITGWAPYRIARAGIGLVPQGRRVFSSLTVKEHLDVTSRPARGDGGWSPSRILGLFPNLRQRQRQ